MPLLLEALDAIAKVAGSTDDIHGVLDLGSGPGVASVALAQRFASALVTAVDASQPLLDRVQGRAARFEVSDRVDTRLADLERPIDDIAAAGSVDVVWASMVLHHVSRLPGVLADVHRLLRPGGMLAVMEFGGAHGAFPDGFNVGREGFAERLAGAMKSSLEEHLPAGATALDWKTLLTSAGFELLVDRELAVHRPPPLTDMERQSFFQTLQMTARHVEGRLDQADLAVLIALIDVTDPRCVLHRNDLPLDISRRLLLAHRREP